MLKYRKSIIRFAYLLVLLIVLLCAISSYRRNNIYSSLNISYDNKNVKFGNKITADDIVKTSNAPYKIVKGFDSNKLGEQEILVEITKEDVTKVIPIYVTVVDETKPVITLNNEDVSVTVGNEFKVADNIKSVVDDGVALKYIEKPNKEDRSYYTINGVVDTDTLGTFEVEVIAVDRANNISNSKFSVSVINEVVVPTMNTEVSTTMNDSLPATANAGDLVSIAYSLVGSPYVSGGNQPGGFDCSGFVQYVYSRVGKQVSRSSYTQAYDGVAVSYANAKPGDILNFGHGGVVSHSALYVGNGLMIHATNPSQGVIVSSVAGWESGSIDKVMGVRRVN